VLVAIDDSDASERVATFVNAFFHGLEVELLVVSVARVAVPMIPVGTAYGAVAMWPGPVAEEEFRAAQAVADEEARRAATDSGLADGEQLLTSGDPVEQILRAARDHDVDLVVVGTGHKGLLERAFKGSVSRDLLESAERPVLVVP
jgi:nucleotide-binding universal stress UspA family protein